MTLQFYKGLNITADQKKIFKKALNTYYDAVQELLQSEHSVSSISSFVPMLVFFLFPILINYFLIDKLFFCKVTPPNGA